MLGFYLPERKPGLGSTQWHWPIDFGVSLRPFAIKLLRESVERFAAMLPCGLHKEVIKFFAEA
jgi:hypothetical protein